MYHVLHRRLTPWAFTVRPCSFSNMCCGEIVTLALRLSSLDMHLVKSRQAVLWAACRRLSTGAGGEDCGLLHSLRRTTWLVQLFKVLVA